MSGGKCTPCWSPTLVLPTAKDDAVLAHLVFTKRPDEHEHFSHGIKRCCVWLPTAPATVFLQLLQLRVDTQESKLCVCSDWSSQTFLHRPSEPLELGSASSAATHPLNVTTYLWIINRGRPPLWGCVRQTITRTWERQDARSYDWQCCNLIGDPVFTDQKVLGPRNRSMFTRRPFPLWVSLVPSRPTHTGRDVW